MSRCIPLINPNLPIPELIKILRHSFREADFLEVQTILVDREKRIQIEIQNLQMGHNDAPHKDKLRRSRRKCKVLNEEITSLNYKLAKLVEEIEDLKRQNAEAAKAMDDLRERKRESDDELAKFHKSRYEERTMKVEGSLAKILNVKAEDLAKLVDALENHGVAMKAENLDLDSGNVNLVHPRAEDDDDGGAQSGGSPPRVSAMKGKVTVGALAGDVIVIHDDNDDEANHVYTAHVSDTSSEQMIKRKGRDCTAGSPLNLIRKMKKRTWLSNEEDVPTDEKETRVPCDDSQSVDSADSDEVSSYSDGYMERLVATIQKLR